MVKSANHNRRSSAVEQAVVSTATPAICLVVPQPKNKSPHGFMKSPTR
jgi:hypothetical protein